MKSVIFSSILLIILFQNSSYSQSIVRNFGFDDHTSDHPCIDNINANSFLEKRRYYDNIPHWSWPIHTRVLGIGTSFTSDILCTPKTNGMPPSPNAWGFTHGNSPGYSDSKAGEFLVGEFSEDMHSGVTYLIEYRFKGGQSVNRFLGIAFFSQIPKQKTSGLLEPGPNTPDISVSQRRRRPNNSIGNYQWSRGSQYFVPEKTYKNIVLGGFAGSDGSVEWDDIRVTKACDTVRRYDNLVFYNEDMIYQASDRIIAGEGADPEIRDGQVLIADNSRVIFQAPNVIELTPGFDSQHAEYYEAVNKGCDPDPCPQVPGFPRRVESCNGDPIQLGTQPEEGLFIEWSPSEYLSDNSVANPVFTPPSSGDGEQIYTATISTICGQQTTREVQVNYDSDPKPPSLTLQNVVNDPYRVSFDAVANDDVEYIEVEIPGTPYKERYYAGEDLNCCTLSWSEFLSECMEVPACKPHSIKVSAKNFCHSEKVTRSIGHYTPGGIRVLQAPNVYTPNDDGVNDEFCFITSGVNHFDLTIYDRWGDQEYSVTGCMNENPLCFSPSLKPGETKFYTARFTNECGNIYTVQNSLTVLGMREDDDEVHDHSVSALRDGMNDPSADTLLDHQTQNGADLEKEVKDPSATGPSERENEELASPLRVFPNPSEGIYTLSIKNPGSKTVLVKVLDQKGKLVQRKRFEGMKTRLDISSEPGGKYYLILELGGKRYYQKLIKY